MEPVTAITRLVLAHLLHATANADERTNGLSIYCAGVLDGHNDSARRVCITPHCFVGDADKPVVELVRAIVHQGDIADYDAPRSVDVDATKGFDGKGRKPIAVECRVHPVLLRDKQHAIPRLNNTGGHGRRANVLDDAGRVLRGL